MKRLAVYLKGYYRETVMAPLFKLMEAFFDLLVPVVVAKIINVGIANGDTDYILHEVLILVLLAVAGLACSMTAQYMAARASSAWGARTRQALFDHVENMSYAQLDHIGANTLITRLTSDINQAQSGFNMMLRLLLRSPFIVFGCMIMAFTINVQAALVFAVSIPILAAAVLIIMIVSIPLFRKVQMKLDQVTGLTRENLTGVRVIRAFGKEREEVKSFDNENEALTRMNEFVGKLSALLNPLTYALINIATIILIQVGAVQVNLGSIAQGDVVALYNYMAQMVVELVKLASLVITINKSIACANRVSQVFAMEEGMDYPSTSPSVHGNGTVVMDHISLTYQGDSEAALSDISFSVNAGSTVGIIGGTGCGKSSLVNLIPRFYDVDAGSVTVDGINVKEYPQEELMNKIGVVPQKAVLFQGTIRDNMKWGNENASDDEIWQALKTAQADRLVRDKENGLDFVLEQNGRNLSGGQKQRLTIARALIKRPEILIMDDSASALDFATDASLRQAVRQMEGHTTVFIVSQRTSSIMQADEILVLDDGRLVGKGTHEQLMHACSVYREIFYSQFPEKREAEVSGKEVAA